MIIFLISETFKSISRSKMASIITINTIALAVLFSLATLFVLFYAPNFERMIKDRVEVILFVQNGNNNYDALANKLKKDEYVKSIRFVDKAAAADEFREKTGEDFSGLLDDNPLPPSFRIKVKQEFIDLSKIDVIKVRFQNYEGVTDVIFDYDFILKILKIIKSTKLVIYLLSSILIFAAIYLVYSTNRFQIQQKMNEYHIMKLVGASHITIKVPIYLSGIFLGIIASIICALLVTLIMAFLDTIYQQFSFREPLMLMLAAVFMLGLFFGLLGSYFSSKRIKWEI